MAHGHLTIGVATATLLDRFEKRFFRFVGRHFFVGIAYSEAGSGTNGFKFLYSHDLLSMRLNDLIQLNISEEINGFSCAQGHHCFFERWFTSMQNAFLGVSCFTLSRMIMVLTDSTLTVYSASLPF
jgi:hypothetical protein